MEFRFFTAQDFAVIHRTHRQAFADYLVKMELSAEQLTEMMVRRAMNYDISVGAFDDGNLVAFNLNGIDDWQGRRTVYDLSTGVIPAYRRRGLTAQLFAFSEAKLKAMQARQYLLEVIEANEKARRAYEKIGFQITREFDCFILKSPTIKINKTKNISYQIAARADWPRFQAWWQWQPGWQNSSNAIMRSRDEKLIMTASEDGNIVGYGIIYPASGDIAQLAVAEHYRGKGIGGALVGELLKYLKIDKPARVINVERGATATKEFLIACGFEYFIGQKEMMLEL
jgi:ribosomal protein S18 acetylase RimI-like enzyme